MPAGDRSRTWFPEMVEVLRREWKPDIPWEEIIALRDCLDSMLQQIRLSRGIRPPTMWCPVCNKRTQQASPSVSVRAVIFALGRFGIASQTEFKSLEKRWAKHRKENKLNRNGRPSQAITRPSSDGPPHFTRTIPPRAHGWPRVKSTRGSKTKLVGRFLPMMLAGGGRDRLRAVREIGRQTRQCLTARRVLTARGK